MQVGPRRQMFDETFQGRPIRPHPNGHNCLNKHILRQLPIRRILLIFVSLERRLNQLCTFFDATHARRNFGEDPTFASFMTIGEARGAWCIFLWSRSVAAWVPSIVAAWCATIQCPQTIHVRSSPSHIQAGRSILANQKRQWKRYCHWMGCQCDRDVLEDKPCGQNAGGWALIQIVQQLDGGRSDATDLTHPLEKHKSLFTRSNPLQCTQPRHLLVLNTQHHLIHTHLVRWCHGV
jgi:hypothetical protein